MSGLTASRPEIVLVAAIAENGVIGRDNAIPWRLKSDQRRFKQMTLGRPVVMGRKTFISLRRPLPGRTNIVVTRDGGFCADGVVVTMSLSAARAIATADALRRLVTEVAVIGGAEVYAEWMQIADRLEVTEVHAKPDGDTFFPPIDPDVWREVARTRHPASAENSSDFSYVTYRRCCSH